MNIFRFGFQIFTALILVLSSWLQTGVFVVSEVLAAGAERRNVALALVDTAIHDAIAGDLARYGNTYIPQQSPGTDLLILPIDPAGFTAANIQTVISNLYFDGHEDKTTNIVGIMLFGDIPLPSIMVDGKLFQSIFPYTDLEGPPMFAYDPGLGYREGGNNPYSQPELRHAMVPGRDIGLFNKFFSKIKEYAASPSEYAIDRIWYDDYQLMQNAFSDEQIDEYMNTLLFAEDRSYKRINKSFTDVLNAEYTEDILETIDEANQAISQSAITPGDEYDHPDVNEAGRTIERGVEKIMSYFEADEIKNAMSNASDSPIPTLLNAKQNENNFRNVFSIYGDDYLSTMETNLAAGGRYDVPKIDNSLDMIQLKDNISVSFLKDMNTTMEQLLDAKIQEQQYMLKYPLPTFFEERVSFLDPACEPPNPLTGKLGQGIIKERYENFYYGRYAGDIQQYDELSVFRGTYNNLDNSAKVLSSSIDVQEMDDVPYTPDQFAMGASYGQFAQQTQEMRGFDLDLTTVDLELREETKCKKKDELGEWSLDYRGGASPLNLDGDALEADPNDLRFNSDYYDRLYMRHPTTNRALGGPQYSAAGALLVDQEETPLDVGLFAHNVYPEVVRTDYTDISFGDLIKNGGNPVLAIAAQRAKMHCKPRIEKDDYPQYTPYEEVEFFRVREEELELDAGGLITIHVSQNPNEQGGGVDRFEASPDMTQELDNEGLMDLGREPWFMESGDPPFPAASFADISPLANEDFKDAVSDLSLSHVQEGKKDYIRNYPRTDADNDGRFSWTDSDIDGNSMDNVEDIDVDGDGELNTEDRDIDNDGIENRQDEDVDGDGIPNDADADQDADGVISDDRNDEMTENQDNNGTEDTDKNGCKGGGGGGGCGGGGSSNPQATPEEAAQEAAEQEQDQAELDQLPSGLDLLVDAGGTDRAIQSFFGSADHLVVDLSASNCTYCTDLARQINNDSNLKNQLSNTCNMVTLVPKNNLSDRRSSIGGKSSRVGGHSAQLKIGELRDIEALFEGGSKVNAIPHIFIIDRDGKVVSRSAGGLPADLDTYCDPGQISLENLDDETIAGISPQFLGSMHNVTSRIFDDMGHIYAYVLAGIDYVIDIAVANISIDTYAQTGCIPLVQDDDNDDDGLPNTNDEDIDGDGLLNTADPDVDGDCEPNTTDPDIDGDGEPNGRDSDCNGGGGSCNKDNDDDSDGLSDDVDPDDDNDGTLDTDEPDQDQDGIIDSEDPDDDNDGIDDSADPDDDNDGIADGDEVDTDGDGTANDDDHDIDNDGVDNENDDDIDGDGIPNDEDDDTDGDGIPNDIDNDDDGDGIPDASDETPTGEDEEVNQNPINPNTGEPYVYGLPYNTDMRDVGCGGQITYKKRHIYDYHILDTVIQHKSPTNTELADKHILTMERAIDDPRYTTFHGVGGDLVKLIYPDVYQVETYDGGTLKSEDEIAASIRTYLVQKVQAHNELLQTQLASAPGYYSQHPDAYDFLATVHSSATPNRTYDMIPESFFLDVVGEDNVLRIANALYYLSLPREQRPTGSNFQEFIDSARQTFDLDRKLEYIAEQYLLTDEELPTDDPIRLPRYIDPEQKKAYEVVYINSDGKDSQMDENTIRYDRTYARPEGSDDIGNNTTFTTQASEEDEAIDNECNIPPEGCVPLLKRPKALSCRLNYTTQNKVIDFELTIDIDFNDDKLEQLFLEWMAKKNAKNEGSSGPRGAGSTGGSDGTSEPGRTVNDGRNPVRNILSTPAFGQSSTVDLQTLEFATNAGWVQSSTIVLGEADQDPLELYVQADRDIGVIDIDISLSSGPDGAEGGDIVMGGQILNGGISYSDDLSRDLVLPLTIDSTQAGSYVFDIQMCVGITCLTEQVTAYVLGSILTQAQVRPLSSQLMRNGVLPVILSAQDVYNNAIMLSDESVYLKVEGGKIQSAGGDRDQLPITDRDQQVRRLIPDQGVSELVVSLEGTQGVYDTQTITVLDDVPQISIDDRYRLPTKSIGFVNEAGLVRKDVIRNMDISIPSAGSGFVLPYTVRSIQGNMDIGTIDAQGKFVSEESFIQYGDSSSLIGISDGKTGVYQVGIQFAGYDEEILEYEVLAVGPEEVILDFPQTAVEPGQDIEGDITVRDSRGNLFTEEVTVDLIADGAWELDEDKLTFTGGKGSCSGKASSGGGSCGAKASAKASNSDGGDGGDDGGGSDSGSSDGGDGGEGGDSGDGEGADGSDADGEGDSEDSADDNESEEGEGDDAENDDDGSEDESGEDNENDDESADRELGSDPDAGYGTATFQTDDVLRPDEREPQELNGAYVNLYGTQRGDRSRIRDLLRNRRTLAVTTTHALPGSSIFEGKKFSLSGDGTYDDEFGVIKNLELDGEHVWMNLGHNGGDGRIYMGAGDDIGLVDRDYVAANTGLDDEKDKVDPEPEITISPLDSDSFHEGNVFWIDEEQVGIDFEFGYIHDEIRIVPRSSKGNKRYVTYKNIPIGELTLELTTPLLQMYLENDAYIPVQNSNNLVSFEFNSPVVIDGDLPLFEGLSLASDPDLGIGFQHGFAGITNFAQGMPVGQANKAFADPYLINFGDPFFTRIGDSDVVKETDFDAGIGQQIYTSEKKILDVVSLDADDDSRDDIAIAYQDGTVRFLKNYGGRESLTDLGTLVVINDGIQEIFPGDVDADGDDDLVILTQDDKLRAYTQQDGVWDVDGTAICLDIPNGQHGSVAAVTQLFVKDIDGDGAVDIVTNAHDGEVELFYGGGNNYLSTDMYACDDQAISRNKKRLLKSFALTAGGPFSDESLVHREGLEVPEAEEEPEISGYEFLENNEVESFELPKKKKEIDALLKSKKEEAIGDMEQLDIDQLIQDGLEKAISYMIQAPQTLRPDDEQDNELYAFMRAQDTLESADAQVKVSKTLSDDNGGTIQKGDILTITVNIDGAGPIDYLEKLDIPVMLFRNENGTLHGFDRGSLPDSAVINRNIAQGYEFHITDIPGSVSFSYQVQFNGNGHATVSVEPDLDAAFETGVSRVSGLFGTQTAHAQSGGSDVRITLDDGCYKNMREFSPGETLKDLTSYYKQERDRMVEFYEDQRTDTNQSISEVDLDVLQSVMGLNELDFDMEMSEGIEAKINEFIIGASTTSAGVALLAGEYDIGTEYLDQFADTLIEGMDQICKGMKFGENSCGGLPTPFNVDFLSPGTFNVFGCKLADFDGFPILSFPATLQTVAGPAPVPGPILGQKESATDAFKSVVGGVYGSKFRMYVSPTLTGGLGLSVCFGPNKSGMNIKSPVGDIAGNCIVIAGPIGPSCTDDQDEYDNDGARSTSTLTPELMDLSEMNVCDSDAQRRSPFISSATGGPTIMSGSPMSVFAHSIGGGDIQFDLSGGQGGRSQDIIQFDKYSLDGGNNFDLALEGGDFKGIRECIVNKRADNQIRYIMNNLTNMEVNIALPDFDRMVEGRGEGAWTSFPADLVEPFKNMDGLLNSRNPGLNETWMDPDKAANRFFMPKDVLHDMEDMFTNPFEQFGQLFDSIPLINVKTKRIRLQIPRLFEEDIVRLETEWKAREHRNKQIIDARSEFGGPSAVEIQSDMKNQLKTVQRNLQTIDQYKRLPTQLYDYLHARDKYITEVFSFTDDFVRQLTGWMQQNALRYSQYVDAIITLIGVIQTRQPLIDISTKWRTRCAKCTVDNYDFYSCKLSMLCVDLPILPIPPFKIPDIYIDVSQINLGMDILLPKFVFLPEKIQYPMLPDLPDPRDFEFDLEIDLPEIPLLPAPPTLPPLPDIELEADIQLPTLPPAPKIPNISPVISKVIKIADFVGTVFCIFKSGVGLVAEQGVKTRVEQLTQRTRPVEPFDSLSIVLPEPPLPGFDIQITATVDLEFSFDQLYDVLDEIADETNKEVSKMMDGLQEKLVQSQNNRLGEDVGDFLNDANDLLQDGANLELDLDIEGALNGGDTGRDIDVQNLLAQQGTTDFIRPQLSEEQEDFHAREHTGGEYTQVKERLLDDIYASLDDIESNDQKAFTDIANYLSKDVNVRWNYEGVDQVRYEAQQFLNTYAQDMSIYTADIEQGLDYFLTKHATQHVPVGVEDEVVLKQFGTNVMLGDDWIRDTLMDQPHPVESWIDAQRGLLSGYSKALDTNSPADLSMSGITHSLAKTYIQTLEDKLDDTGTYVYEPQGLTSESKNTISDHVLPHLAQVDAGRTSLSPNSPTPTFTTQSTIENLADETGLQEVDMTQYIEGFYIKGKDDKYHNVMGWLERAEEVVETGKYMYADVNLDGDVDIVSWTQDSIYIKYNKQKSITSGVSGGSVETLGSRSSMQSLVSTVEEDDGYYQGWKLRSPRGVSHDFARQGSSFDSMGFGRGYDQADGYIISVTHTTDVRSQRDGDIGSDGSDAQKYILVLPDGMEPGGLDLDIYAEIDRENIQDLIDDGTIISVETYDGRAENISAILTNMPRQWYYTQMAGLTLKSGSGGFLGLGSDTRYLEKTSPWSLQNIAGAQAISDTERPYLELELIRTKTDEIVSEGNLMQGNVMTTYQLSGTWLDNTEIKENRITYDDEVIRHEKTDRVDLQDLYYTIPIVEEFTLSARDVLGNQRDIQVDIDITAPDIQINQVRVQSDGVFEIESELSETVDDGKIAFMRDRYGRREEMDPYTFPVKIDDPKVTGGSYIADDETIQMVDSDGNQRCSCNKNTGKIDIPEDQQANTVLNVGFNDTGNPSISVQDTTTSQSLFSVDLEAQSLGVGDEAITVSDTGYTSYDILDDLGVPGLYGGTCVAPDGDECQIFVDTSGDILIPPQRQDEYELTYEFDEVYDEVIYTIDNVLGQEVMKVRFVASPL